MNRLFVRKGMAAPCRESYLVIEVWDDDTQRRITERDILRLYDTEERLAGGRFAKHLPEVQKHKVELPYVDYGQMRHSLAGFLEWIHYNIEDGWNLSFKDEGDYFMGNPYARLIPIYSFEHLADAVLFKLRFY